ncbi:MAG: hypothetical protein II882_06145 [Lachnospiraceae bacterium]|nr:hypothetical protein [Lachnospiraceae bacterium]
MIEISFEQKNDLGLKYVRDRLETVCPYGGKRLKEEGFYSPRQKEELERELDNVSLLLAALKSCEDEVLDLRHRLSGLKELTASITGCESRALSEVELFELTALCRRFQALIPKAQALPGYEKLAEIDFQPVDGPLRILDPSGSGRLSFYVEDERTPELAKARRQKRTLEKQLKEADAPREMLLRSRQEAVKAEEDALSQIYADMSLALRPYTGLLLNNTGAAGRLDAALAKALLARRCGCCRPGTGGEDLELTEAVHPQIAAALEERGRSFVPVTAHLPRGVTVLTGANMGGKSVAMKTIVLNTALALSGCFVFAKAAQIPMFDRLELINRDFTDTARGLSSFGGEILRFNEAAKHLEEGDFSFIAMDEFARGTNAQEGAAIARGVVRYLSDKKAVTLLATHYDGTAQLAARHYQVRGLRNLPEGEHGGGTETDRLRRIEQAMDYGLIPVENEADCPRDALRICEMLGMEEEILKAIRE